MPEEKGKIMGAYRISYAQNREDIILNALLKEAKSGFYVDVGANHPVHDSVTKLFYDKGWSGINIEPANQLHSLLELTRPRDKNLKVGISNKDDQLTFREYTLGDGLSTFSGETQKAYEKDEHYSYFAKDFIDHSVPVTTLAKILAKHAPGKQIDFMKIDVEGYEYEAVVGNDWTKYRPVIICIEANHIVKDWHPILKKAGYEQVFWDGLNEYFVANEHARLTADFSYSNSIFFSEPYISWSEHKTREDLETDKSLLSNELHNTQKALSTTQAEIIARTQARRSSRVKHGLRRIDNKIGTVLNPVEIRQTGKATDGKSPKNISELSVALKDQLAQTKPVQVRRASRSLMNKSYLTSKKLARRTAKKAGSHE